MTWLFIDTSDDCLFLAIKKENEYFHYTAYVKNTDFQVAFFNKLYEFLKINNINFKEISKVGVIEGAGAYSTIRVGILFAKTLSISYNIPLIALKASHFLFSEKNAEAIYLVQTNDTHYFLYFCCKGKTKKCWLLNLEQTKEIINSKEWEKINNWNIPSEVKKSIKNLKKQNNNKWLHIVGLLKEDLPEIKNIFLTWQENIMKLKKNKYRKIMEKYFNNEDYLVNPLKLVPWYVERMVKK